MEKAALTEASGAHIGSMEEKHEKLSKVNPEVRVLEPHFSEDKQAVRFEFLTGKTLAEELGGRSGERRLRLRQFRQRWSRSSQRQPCAGVLLCDAGISGGVWKGSGRRFTGQRSGRTGTAAVCPVRMLPTQSAILTACLKSDGKRRQAVLSGL
mgnify:CR=1 FL=1